MELPTLETINLMAVLPALSLTGWACFLLVADLFILAGRKVWTAWLTFPSVSASLSSPTLPLMIFSSVVILTPFLLPLQFTSGVRLSLDYFS